MVRLVLMLLSFSVVILTPAAHTKAAETPILYYVLSNSDGRTLYQIVDNNSQPEAIVELPGPYSFSFSGNQFIYMDDYGVWLTDLDDWNPVLIIPAEGYASNWLWTPDDVRFIVRVSSNLVLEGNKITEVSPQTYSYNMVTEQVETWDWGDCKHIGRHIKTHRVAMICIANDWIDNPEVSAIALYWGGEYVPYESDEFELLLEDFYGYRPILPFEWSQINSHDHLVYRARNPDFSLENLEADEPVTDIFWLTGNSDVMSLNLSEDYGLTQWISVSPDRSMVAFDINCNFYEQRYCLAIADLESGEILYDYSSDFFVRFLYDIAWYPDNQRIAFLGQMDALGEPVLIIADIESGQRHEFDLVGSLDQVDSITITNTSAD